MTKRKVLFLLFFLIFRISFGQTQQDKKTIAAIDDLISQRLATIAPGCEILIAKKREIFHQKAFGTANLELNIPTQPNMVFKIGSITKQFTAIAILQLVEQGKILLTDSLQHFIKDFPSKRYPITIENLLTQTSGIADYMNLETNLPNPLRIDFAPKKIIDSLKNLPLEFSPGTKFAYSNSNYFLLGYIIEMITGKSYPEYVKQNIFMPLGMANTYYDSPTEIISNRVNGYERADKTYRNSDFISVSLFYSAGGLLSNVEDLFKWNEALKSFKPVKKEILEKAFTPFKFSDGTFSEYGYGWFLRNIEGSKTIEHGGSIFGFRAEEIYLPQEDIYVVGLFNCRQLNNDEQELCYDIGKIMLGKPLRKDIKISDAILDSYIGTYKYAGPDKTINTNLKIYKENGRLYADLSNGTGSHMPLIPQSETKFTLAVKTPTTIEFIVENDKVIKQVLTQKEKTEFIKIE